MPSQQHSRALKDSNTSSLVISRQQEQQRLECFLDFAKSSDANSVRGTVSRQRLIPPIGLSQCDRAIEQYAEVGVCENSAFVPILKNLALLQEHDTVYLRRDLKNVVRHQQQRVPFPHIVANEVQIVKRRRHIEPARRFVEYERSRIMNEHPS